MSDKILVPTDFSNHSKAVLECLKNFPNVEEVVLLHMVGPTGLLSRVRTGDPTRRIEEAKAKLDLQKASLEGHGFKVKTRAEHITEGDISRAIREVADEEKVSLIAMGARGKGIIEGIFLGNVAKNILLYGNENLLIMRYDTLESLRGSNIDRLCGHPFARVLCPTDLSEPAAEAISFVKGIEVVEEILLQHVVYSGETWKEIESHVEEANKTLNAMAEEIGKIGPKVKVHVTVGSPVEEICDLAKKVNVSLIAISSHGKTREKKFLNQWTVGSVAYETARRADRPVLIVRSKPNA